MLLLLAMCAVPAHAYTRYVTDHFEINIRSGPGTQFRIVRMINSGQKLEVLETEDNWSKIQMPDGLEGWVFTTYLQAAPPARLSIQQLQARLEPLEIEHLALKQEKEEVSSLNQDLLQQLQETEKQLEESVSSYVRLREDSSEFISIKEDYERLTSDLETKTAQIEQLENRLTEHAFSSAIKWFLAGAGVLLLGMLLGSRSRKKRSSGLR